MESKSINYNVISSQKFSDVKWNLIEKPLPDIEKKRNQMICNLGDDNINIKNKSSMVMIGEYYYLKVREIFVNYINLPRLDKIEKNDSKNNKKTKMILDNSYNTLIKPKVDIILYYFTDNIENKNFENMIIKNNYIELRILILMKLIDFYVKKPEIYQEEIEELLIACKKIIFNLKKNDNEFEKICNIDKFEIILCDRFIIDFEYKIKELLKICDIKLFEIANKRPKLIFDTKYDCAISSIKLKPYDTQIEFMDIIKNNMYNEGFLIYMRVLTGLGKTSLITSVCNYVNKNKFYNTKVIFCCSDMLETVRIQVAKLMFNFNIKFGIGTGIKNNDPTKEPSYQIKTSYNCGKINDNDSGNKDLSTNLKKLKLCDMIICDYITTYLLLKENKYEYILFFDEPTIKIKNSNVLEYLSRILYYAPSRFILTSTTLPQRHEIINFENYFKNKYKDSKVFDIISNKVLTSCTLKTFDDEIITPHIYCNNKEELYEYVNKIKYFPLLGKFYSLTFLMNLNNFMKQYNLNINLENIESFDQENIMENILILIINVCDNDCVDFELFKNIKCIEINENKFYNDIMTPHVYCNNRNELLEFKINLFPIFGKYYSFTYLKNLNKFMEQYKLDLKNCNEEDIYENMLILITRVCDNECVDFKLFKNINCIDTINKKNKKIKENNNYKSMNFFKLDHSKLLTSHAFKFFGCTLIATEKPTEYVNNYFKDVLDKIKIKLKIKSMNDMLLDYKKSISLIDAQVADIEKNMENDTDGVKDEIIEKIYNKKKKFPFPNVLKINSEEHIESFSKYVKTYDRSLLRESFHCEDIDITQFSVNDEIKMLLYMNVGVYCNSLDSNYTDKVLELLNENKLSYIICSENFCYGANFAINKIIITDSIGDILSLNSIFQLIGRTSRVSKSYCGETYIENKTMERIVNFFKNTDDNNEESTIIREGFDNCKTYIENKIITDKIKQIEKEKRDKEYEKNKEIERIKKEEMEEKLRIEEEIRIKEEEEIQWAKDEEYFSRNNYPNKFFNNNNDNNDDWVREKKTLSDNSEPVDSKIVKEKVNIMDILENKKSNSKLFGSSRDLKEGQTQLSINKISDTVIKEKVNIMDILENKKSNSKLFGFSKDVQQEKKSLPINITHDEIIKDKEKNIDIIDNIKSNVKIFGFSKDLTEEQKEFRKKKEDRLNNLYKK